MDGRAGGRTGGRMDGDRFVSAISMNGWAVNVFENLKLGLLNLITFAHVLVV